MKAPLIGLGLALLAGAAAAQNIDLSQGGPVEVTAVDGIEWRQNDQVVIARGEARAVRGGVTVESDRLIARYRPRGGAQAQAARPPTEGPAGGGEIWRLEAEGNVVIFTATDRAEGDRAVYDMDQSVMVLTGQNLRLTNPDNTLTARDSIEYWSQRRMAVARGNAVVGGKHQQLRLRKMRLGRAQDLAQPLRQCRHAAQCALRHNLAVDLVAQGGHECGIMQVVDGWN